MGQRKRLGPGHVLCGLLAAASAVVLCVGCSLRGGSATCVQVTNPDIWTAVGQRRLSAVVGPAKLLTFDSYFVAAPDGPFGRRTIPQTGLVRELWSSR